MPTLDNYHSKYLSASRLYSGIEDLIWESNAIFAELDRPPSPSSYGSTLHFSILEEPVREGQREGEPDSSNALKSHFSMD